MGNTQTVIWSQGLASADPSAVFHTLDVEGKGYLTLKDLLTPTSSGLIMPHSLPALYFFDQGKDGRLTEREFTDLVTFCQTEKQKVEDALAHDESFRDLILRASKAGVTDCSVDCRSSFRRFSSYSKVRTVYSRRDTHSNPPQFRSASAISSQHPTTSCHNQPSSSYTHQQQPNSPQYACMSESPPTNKTNQEDTRNHRQSNQLLDIPEHCPIRDSHELNSKSNYDGQHSDSTNDHFIHPQLTNQNPSYIASTAAACQRGLTHLQEPVPGSPAATSSLASDDTHQNFQKRHEDFPTCSLPIPAACYNNSSPSELASVASTTDSTDADETCHINSNTNSSPYAFNNDPSDDEELDWQDPKNRTALDAAAVENIVQANIHKLANLLHMEDSREQFMAWLWNLVDFNSSAVVTIEELRVFIDVLREDGINPEELVFYREGGVPLEECIINEFDTTHASMLSRDEFMVLADLVTREYEFWENRHLERVGDYELGRTIGRGSSGVVRFAVQVGTKKKFAVKIIKAGKCSAMVSIDREIKSLQMAQHSNIVKLEEVLETDDNMFIVMELCGGGSMVDIVRVTPKERMLEDSARFFVRQMFEALVFCHENFICHRDVRLDNIMLDNDGNVKVTDFGHSGQYTMNWDLFSTSLVGSVYNLSPEQINGELYSGERLDIWSAGVAVYCLLVGQPPFFDPDVNILLQKIIAGQFEFPDHLSPSAKDLIRCMIRVNPLERIPLDQMLHHPWFYDGGEKQPQMHVVNIPVDDYFKKRPDIAEMIMAITIYQHNLHFHLADTQNPNSSPDDHRGQDWTLKCLCPRNDIKFTISLFTRKPTAPPPNLGGTSSYISTSDLRSDAPLYPTPQPESPKKENIQRVSLDSLKYVNSYEGPSKIRDFRNPRVVHRRQEMLSCPSRGAGRPPLLRTPLKITPMGVAAHLRNHRPKPSGTSSSISTGDIFDLDTDLDMSTFTVQSFNEELLQQRGSAGESFSSDPLADSSAFDSDFIPEPGRVMRINRSATVDAFPYQKVFPQRKMPESAKHLNFDTPATPPPESARGDPKNVETISEKLSDRIRRGAMHKSMTLHSGCSVAEFGSKRKPGRKEKDIAMTLCRHPSKAMSPHSPQICCTRNGLPEGTPFPTSSEFRLNSPSTSPIPAETEMEETSSLPNSSFDTGNSQNEGYMEESDDESTFEPYLEVRLQDGESGLFLKVCRKLKTICTTKLAAQAERQKRRATGEGRSISALRLSVSNSRIESDVPFSLKDNTRKKFGVAEGQGSESKSTDRLKHV